MAWASFMATHLTTTAEAVAAVVGAAGNAVVGAALGQAAVLETGGFVPRWVLYSRFYLLNAMSRARPR